MSETTESRTGVVRKIGWTPLEDGGPVVFVATIEFPNGPPDLPFDVVWKQRPVVVSLQDGGVRE